MWTVDVPPTMLHPFEHVSYCMIVRKQLCEVATPWFLENAHASNFLTPDLDLASTCGLDGMTKCEVSSSRASCRSRVTLCHGKESLRL